MESVFLSFLPYPYPPQGAFPVPFSLGKGVGPVPSLTPLPPSLPFPVLPSRFPLSPGNEKVDHRGADPFLFLVLVIF